MLNMSAGTLVMVIAVALFTAAAAFTDIRSKRIPNKLTLPMFFAGWVYQLAMSIMYGWQHLGSAVLGFAVGFGLLFVLWMIGGGGGGDVKLMGALSVWLGFTLTLKVLFVSTLIVLCGTAAVVLWSVSRRGMNSTREKYVGMSRSKVGVDTSYETTQDKLGRRVMAYAAPVALATWGVLAWQVTSVDPRAQAPVHEQPLQHVEQPVTAPVEDVIP